MFSRIIFVLLLLLSATVCAAAQADGRRPPRVAVLDFGDTETGRRVAAALAAHILNGELLRAVDSAQARAAARGVGYAGSLNMSLDEARDLGAAVDCDFFVVGDAQTVRRSSSSVPVYYESYASIFVVNARTGRLVMWERPHAEAPTPAEAERGLAAGLREPGDKARVAILRAEEDETRRLERARAGVGEPTNFEDAPEEGSPAAVDFRPPHPYKRLRPAYPETASQAEAEATVDVLVEIDERGEVKGARVVRWAGFGLDEAALAVVRQLHFRPAARSGLPVPVRVLLRYNFRRPSPAAPQQAGEGEMRLGPLFRALIKNDNAP